MGELVESFKRFISKNDLFSGSDRLLVAVSGGVDSVVLVHLLKTIGYFPSIAHCNFQLRGEDSNADETFVKKLAEDYGLTTYFKKFNTTAYAKKHQVSTQVAARDLRYEWFAELMQAHKHDFLLTAHHANDQIETVLYNLTKGTGIAGLRGIPIRNDKILRPLLFAKRSVIEAYATAQHLSWREDLSNQEDKYSRNHLRLNVIPALKELNPGLEQTMLHNRERFEALEKLLLHQADTIRKQYLKESSGKFTLPMHWFDPDTGGLSVLYELIQGFGFNWDQNVSIAEALSNQAVGKQFIATGYSLVVDRNKLEIVPAADTKEIDLEVLDSDHRIETPYGNFEIKTVANDGKWSNDPQIACLDADKLQFPLKVRNWKMGDSFCPLGMTGKKKLSDFMIDEKIPVNLKSRVLLFESNDDIIWVAGYRIDDRYKISSKTKKTLIVKMTTHV